MIKGIFVALGFIFLVWLIPVLFFWIESKSGYIFIKGGQVSSKYLKSIIVMWTVGWAVAATMLVLKAIK